MLDKIQAIHTLGLEFDGRSLKGAALSYSRRLPKLETIFDYILDKNALQDPHAGSIYITEQKQKLDLLIQKYSVATAINAHGVLIRPLELKVKKEKNIDAVLSFQAEPLLPYPVENAVLDKIVLSKDKEGCRLTLCAVRKDHLSQHIEAWNRLDIEPEIIGAAPVSLAIFAQHFTTMDQPFYALHLGYSESFCILLDQGKLIAAQTIQDGLDGVLTVLAKERGLSLIDMCAGLDLSDYVLPALEEHPALKSAVATLQTSIARILYALAKQLKGREINSILITGDFPNGFPELLCSALNKTLLPLEGVANLISKTSVAVFGISERKLQQYALCIGSALSGLPKTRKQINFRKQEFAFPWPWKRLKQPILIYLLLCIGISIALTFYGKAYNNYLEGKIKLHYLELLHAVNKPYADFERQYKGKAVVEQEGQQLLSNVGDLTLDEINKRLLFLEKELQSTPQSFPLQPNVPLVSDVLAWISTHPNFVGKDGVSSLQIESFNYSVVKRPEPTKKQERYQIKVELEFSSPAPKMAREFHDALIAPNDMMDPKGEIKWNSNRDRYRTSFYLKDKTIYPNP